MAATIITTEDLIEFKMELLDEIKILLQDHSGQHRKKLLKSSDVRKLLGITSGTLQTLRVNGTLPFSKIGGAIYYDYDEIRKVFEQNRVDNKF